MGTHVSTLGVEQAQGVTDDMSMAIAGRGTTRPQFYAWVFILLAVLYLTVMGGGAFIGLYYIELRILSVAALAVAVAIWMYLGARNPTWRPRSALAPAMIAVIVALAASLAASSHPTLGLEYLAYAALLAPAYLLFQRLMAHPYFAHRLGSLAVLLGFSLSAVYIAAVLLRWIEMWSTLGRWITPPLRPGFEGLLYGNPSAVAAAVILLWFASAAHLGFSTARRRALLTALGTLTAVVVVLSGSRGAWVGAAASLAVVGSAWLLVGSHRRAVAKVVHSRPARLGGLVALIATAGLAVVLLPGVLSRLSEGAAELRSALVATAWRMFLADPVTGIGPGMYVVERSAYTLPEDVDFYVAHAHNVLAQTLAELGLVGVAGAIVVIGNVGLLILRAIRSDETLRQRYGWAALAGVLYLAVHQQFDFYMNMPALGLLLALTIARLDAMTTERPIGLDTPGRIRTPRWAPALAVATILVGTGLATGWLARSEQIALVARDATNAANRGDWSTALFSSRVAVDAYPDWPPYLFTLGLAAAHQGELEAARDAFQQSAVIDAYPTAWLNVARLELDLGNEAASGRAADKAMRLGYQQPQVAVGAASIYVELGDAARASGAAYDALIHAPGLAGDPFWRSTRDLELAWSTAMKRALGDLPAGWAYLLALEAGEPATARGIVQTMPGSARGAASSVVEAWTGDADAFAAVRALTVANPLDAHTVALCHRVASHARDELGLDPAIWQCDRAGYAFEPIVFRVGAPPTGRVPLPGPNSSWHFQGAYERFVPFDELVPGLPHLEVV